MARQRGIKASTDKIIQSVSRGGSILTTNGSNPVLITGMEITIDVPEGATVRVSGMCNCNSDDSSDRVLLVEINEDGVAIANSIGSCAPNEISQATGPGVGGRANNVFATAIFTPTAGSHTYDLRLGREGSNDARTYNSYLIVEVL